MGKAAFFNGDIYVMGGETLSGAGAVDRKRLYNRVDIYNVATNTWRLGPPMPTARHGIYPLLVAGRSYVGLGGTQAGVSDSAVMEVLYLD
jgi:hypothetical protein